MLKWNLWTTTEMSQPVEDVVCRSIKTLRPPYVESVDEQDVRAAALQYVRKVSGFRAPAPHNAEAFDAAVAAVAAATQRLLAGLVVRGADPRGQRLGTVKNGNTAGGPAASYEP